MPKLLQQYVELQADRRPEAVAVVMGGSSVTYGELEARSNQLAALLEDAGCERGDRVALFLPKSIQAITAILGVLKADCAYVPIDTASPAVRVGRMVDVAEPRCALGVPQSARLLSEVLGDGDRGRIRIGWLAEDVTDASPKPTFSWRDVLQAPAGRLEYRNTSGDMAHLLFTSGSTGIPKGVMIAHESVSQFITWAMEYFGTAAGDRISGHPPLHFDLSTFDIYGTLAAGGQLHLVSQELNLLPHKVAEFIRKSELTQWFSVPSILMHMAKFDVVKANDFPVLRRLIWCGEAFPTPGLMYWMRRLPHVTFTNLYGPTEATIASSYYQIPSCPEDERAPIPIGSACPGEQLLILDEHREWVPSGEVGDLYIGGVGLSPGYWRDPEKTAAAFIDDARHGRIYRTGDLARMGNDGLVYLIGRADSQIKVRGYRIELGEIEAALSTVTELRESAVVATDAGGLDGVSICCAYVPTVDAQLPPQELRKHLGRLLPAHMLPTRWMTVEKLPRNANGKVDRPKLREEFKADTSKPVLRGGVS